MLIGEFLVSLDSLLRELDAHFQYPLIPSPWRRPKRFPRINSHRDGEMALLM